MSPSQPRRDFSPRYADCRVRHNQQQAAIKVKETDVEMSTLKGASSASTLPRMTSSSSVSASNGGDAMNVVLGRETNPLSEGGGGGTLRQQRRRPAAAARSPLVYAGRASR